MMNKAPKKTKDLLQKKPMVGPTKNTDASVGAFFGRTKGVQEETSSLFFTEDCDYCGITTDQLGVGGTMEIVMVVPDP